MFRRLFPGGRVHFLQLLALLAAIGVLVAVVASFRGSDVSDEERRQWPLVLYPGPWTGEDARLEGILTLEGRCLYVQYEGDSNLRALIALPAHGTSWDSDTQILRIKGRNYVLGRQAAFGGGVWGHWPTEWTVPPDPSCDTSHFWIGRPAP